MKLTRDDLWSLEEYAECREDFRKHVIEHKKNRQVYLGAHATLYFENTTTMKYQIQEMLRVEKIFTANEIEEELSAYNPLIPDGTNLKATFMIEYPDVEERRAALSRMQGIEHRVWVQIGDHDRVYATANEDLNRSNESKTAAVHFLRFELSAPMRADTTSQIRMGIDHAELPYEVTLDPAVAASLRGDFED